VWRIGDTGIRRRKFIGAGIVIVAVALVVPVIVGISKKKGSIGKNAVRQEFSEVPLYNHSLFDCI
jgi:hypothetical protein